MMIIDQGEESVIVDQRIRDRIKEWEERRRKSPTDESPFPPLPPITDRVPDDAPRPQSA